MNKVDINSILIRKQADFVMLNSCSVNSSGLYNGKAGMALALFETANILDDNYIEEQALQTLQEALLTQNKDTSFESGLSGIGYVLLCLIRNELIDADFDELFADKLALIHKYATKLCADAAKGNLQIDGMKIILFMDLHHLLTGNNQSLELRNRLLNAYGEIFKKLLSEFRTESEPLSHNCFLMFVENYLRIVNECNLTDIPTDVIDYYITGYESGRWMSRFPMAASLYGLAQKAGNTYWEAYALQQAGTALRVLDVRKETLRNMTDILSYEIPMESYREKSEEIRKFLFSKDEQVWMRNLSCAIPRKNMAAGYMAGMARLLLCTVNEYTGKVRIKMW